MSHVGMENSTPASTRKLFMRGGWMPEDRCARVFMRFLIPAFLAIAVLYSLMMPAWLNSDEPFHYKYVKIIQTERRVPKHNETYQAAHPPLYYSVAAVWGLPFRSASSDTQNHWLRLMSVVFGTFTILIIYRIGRDALGSPALGAGMAAFAAINPAFVVMNSVVNNDTAAILACSAAIYLILMINRNGGGVWRAAACGAASGLCCLVKINANLIPVFFLFFYALHPGNRTRRASAVCMEIVVYFLVFAALASSWFVAGYLNLGDRVFFNPVNETSPNYLHIPGNLLWFVKTHALNFWIPQDYLRGYPMNLPFILKLLYFIMSAIVILLATAGLVWAARAKPGLERHAMLSFYICAVVYLAQMAVYNAQMPVAQARYAYIIIAPIAAMAAAPAKRLLGARFGAFLFVCVIVGFALHLAWSLWLMRSIGPMPFTV